MDIVLACIADNANVSLEHKLNVHGIFDTIFAQQFPATHLSLALVLRVRSEYEDRDRTHKLKARLVDADHRQMLEIDGEAKVSAISPGVFSHADQVIHLRVLTFHRPGRYRFIIDIDGREAQSVVFQVLQGPPQLK